jgi:hypothetical protein
VLGCAASRRWGWSLGDLDRDLGLPTAATPYPEPPGGCGNDRPGRVARWLLRRDPGEGKTDEMNQSRGKPLERAQAIAAGLVRTGRAATCRAAAGFIRADGGGAAREPHRTPREPGSVLPPTSIRCPLDSLARAGR